MMRWGTRVRRSTVGGLVGAILLAGCLTGCTEARSNLGTSDSSCYLALPAAADAVHEAGHFAGIRLFTRGQLHSLAPRLTALLQARDDTAAHMCVAAFTGSFSSSSVSKPLGRSHGTLAVVVVNASSRGVLATVIFKKTPLNFTHSHLG